MRTARIQRLAIRSPMSPVAVPSPASHSVQPNFISTQLSRPPSFYPPTLPYAGSILWRAQACEPHAPPSRQSQPLPSSASQEESVGAALLPERTRSTCMLTSQQRHALQAWPRITYAARDRSYSCTARSLRCSAVVILLFTQAPALVCNHLPCTTHYFDNT